MSLVLEIDIWAQIVQLSGPSASSLSCPHWCFLGPRPRPLGQETLHWHQETKTGEEERKGSSQDPWLLWKRYLTLKVRDLASLVAQLVKNLPAMQETPVRFLGQEWSPGEGIVYPLQYSWAFLVAQTVKNLPAMQETWVCSLGWEDHLGNPLHYSCLENPMDRGAWHATVHGVAKSWAWLSNWVYMHTIWEPILLGSKTGSAVDSLCNFRQESAPLHMLINLTRSPLCWSIWQDNLCELFKL